MKARTQHPLMTSAEVAYLFDVTTATVRRWAEAGSLTEARTIGGHRRFKREEVEALARANGIEP